MFTLLYRRRASLTQYLMFCVSLLKSVSIFEFFLRLDIDVVIAAVEFNDVFGACAALDVEVVVCVVAERGELGNLKKI